MGHGHVSESLREHQAEVDQCVARVERLTNRLRMQDWYHELSDQESEDDIDRMVGEQSRPTPPRRSVQRIGSPHLRLNNGSVSSDEFQLRGLDRDAFMQ